MKQMKPTDMIIKILIINIMNIKIILVIFIVFYTLFTLFKLRKEGFENDNMVYNVCRNKYNDMNNDFYLKENDLSPLPTGFYSALLTVGGARKDKQYFDVPICEESRTFNNDYFINNKITNCPELPETCDRVSNINKDTYKGNKLPLEDPNFLHGSVLGNNKILYDEKLLNEMLEVHNVNVEDIVQRTNDHH